MKNTLLALTTLLAFGLTHCSSAPEQKAEEPAKTAEPPAKTATPPAEKTKTTAPKAAAAKGKKKTVVPGLEIEELVVGTGTEATSGKNVKVHYTGWLTNGTKFDSSVDRGTPFEFPLGAGRVIQGWDKGVAGMKIGGKRKLTIAPELGYGPRGAGGVIPPNATLVFEVE
ncbi:FKBP-type peptidyl-prolyl cis-trans isomerase, partial [bacterium]|nr:FKBP-type peptidyl-prolyl cis-trans isomerase [bacterium]